MSDEVYIYPTADVSPKATLGPGTRVWHEAQVREGAVIGRNCILGKGAYVDFGVRIGDNVKVQNRASIYHGVTLENGVFVGPHVVFTNDRLPRAINPDGSIKRDADWEVGEVLVKEGASLGAGSVIVAGVTIGRFALVGAGSVVTRDVPDFGLVYGNPARLAGYVCENAHRAEDTGEQRNGGRLFRCPTCGREVIVRE
ncbi:MAG: UDP-2-acetamido-3-amino-2,3-dideoxy-glucuronate N-acetyltransferase [Chloroflexia bacterium]|jgi:acetyltransferase-like isoleucine patch superfamily enzyme|nr:UDP-2-acetamido-3-amino-2,3-dideoxy-glucuronate N-acetyltransferase [Chloroflexia bacterium]